MVEDWVNKRDLAKIGFSFDPSNLTDFEVSCFGIIGAKFRELEAKKLAKRQTQ